MAIPEIDDIATRNAHNGPNFKLILALACAALLAILVGAYFLLDWDGKRLIPKADHTTSSQLVQPAVCPMWRG